MRHAVLGLVLSLALASPPRAGERVPGATWSRYVDPAEAGFDAAELQAAREVWEGLPSSAFLVVADGAVVAAWGDCERRFMCHSVRKSFLAALYGIYWDEGQLELNKTLADLGLDDEPDPLLETEKQARILDLLKARSGVFHPAAYAGRTDSRPRGSEGPGRFFAYNNWDFNTLATILMKETGDDVFESFDEHFAQPLGMQDWRVSDGYYHYERDKSQYPAYPFRMSARDAARFGLLFTRLGAWGDQRILSRNWVRRCTALYSIDTPVMGYGFMWWVYREPRFEKHGMVSALGVGNQMIAALPDSDLVIVNRANTYDGEGTPLMPLLALIEQVLEARTGTPVDDPELVPLEEGHADPRITSVPAADLEAFVGRFTFPPAPLGVPEAEDVEIRSAGDHLLATVSGMGTFALYLQPDGTLHAEDLRETLFPIRTATGEFAGVVDVPGARDGTLAAFGARDDARREELLALLPEKDPVRQILPALQQALSGDFEGSVEALQALGREGGPGQVEAYGNAAAHYLLRAGNGEDALVLFELDTAAFPRSANAWDSLAEAHMTLGNEEDALQLSRMALDLDPENTAARERIARLQVVLDRGE